MTSDQALRELADGFGILPSYHDMSGHEHQTDRDTQIALLRANGLMLDTDAMIFEALSHRRNSDIRQQFPGEIIIQSGVPWRLDPGVGISWAVTLDGDTSICCKGNCDGGLNLPALPSGLHDLVIHTGKTDHSILLIAAPARLPSLHDITGADRIWGINTALYGLRSAGNLGLGTFGDLGAASKDFAKVGAGFLGINPVHALGWADRATISPYSPSHRGFLNTQHVGPGAGVPDVILTDGERALAARLRDGDLLDYSAIHALTDAVLERAYQAFCDAGAAIAVFDRFCRDQGQALKLFATYEAISEEFGPDWRTWPADLRHPASASVKTAARRLADRIRFHSWLQWAAHEQLTNAQGAAKSAGMSLGLYLDLAVGPRRGGAETWCSQDVVANGVSIGAPPDHLSPAGQNWDLAGFAPEKSRRSKFTHFQRTLSGTMRHAGVMRIDHILGINRSFWIPDDGSRGAYIKQPIAALLAIIAIEAERHGTVVIGEDLGLVPDGFRETLAARGLYSYSVLQYEKDHAGQYRSTEHLRAQSLACFSTHDTPTLRGFWTGRDIDWWQKLDWIDGDQAGRLKGQRGCERGSLLALSNDAVEVDDPRAVSSHIHRQLAHSPAAMVSVQLDDVLEVEEAQNLPGTIDEHPNWRRRCPVATQDFGSDTRLAAIGQEMEQGGRSHNSHIAQEELAT